MLGAPAALRSAPGHPPVHLVPPGSNVIEVQMGIVVIQMPWWEAILFFAAVILAIWGFMSMVGFRTRYLTHGRTVLPRTCTAITPIRRVSSAATPDVTVANGGTSRAGARQAVLGPGQWSWPPGPPSARLRRRDAADRGVQDLGGVRDRDAPALRLDGEAIAASIPGWP